MSENEHNCSGQDQCYQCDIRDELEEQSRLLGMSGEREAKLLAEIEEHKNRHLAWTEYFKETQLSHVSARFDSLNARLKRQESIIAQQKEKIDELEKEIRDGNVS